MSKRANKRIRQLERRLALLEKQQTTGCACRRKQACPWTAATAISHG